MASVWIVLEGTKGRVFKGNGWEMSSTSSTVSGGVKTQKTRVRDKRRKGRTSGG